MTKGQEDLTRLLKAMATGSTYKDAKHDIILNAAADSLTALRARVEELEGALGDVQPILQVTRLASGLGERHLAIETRVHELLSSTRGRRT